MDSGFRLCDISGSVVYDAYAILAAGHFLPIQSLLKANADEASELKTNQKTLLPEEIDRVRLPDIASPWRVLKHEWSGCSLSSGI